MSLMQIKKIGVIRTGEDGFRIELEQPFRPGLEGLKEFGWVQLLWWAHQNTNAPGNDLVCRSPYRGGPEKLGVFATRSPHRPNPICLSAAQLTGVDEGNGILRLAWTDCADGTPLLDVKPYRPSSDRVASPQVPDWCSAWPASIEASAAFDWGAVLS